MDDDKLRIAALQGVLSAAGSYRHRVDGTIGSFTRRAIKSDPEIARRAVDVIGGDVLERLLLEATSDQRKIIEIIREVAEDFGLDPRPFLAKAKTESDFNPNSLSSSKEYKGLFQMGQLAWKDADKTLLASNQPGLGDYDLYWSDPIQNTRAAMAYGLAVEDGARALGWNQPLSEGDKYLAHQQGPYGFVRLQKAAQGQALSPKDSVAMLRAMRSNAPQDGLGVTVDPREFIARWNDVIDQRIASALA